MSRILVIEDEENVNRGISFALEREGYEVAACLSAEEARKSFEQNRPELIICDVNLKDGSGLDFVRIPAGYAFFRYGKAESFIGLHIYHFPVKEVFIMLVVIGMLQFMLSYILSRNVKKESLIERIRYQG